MSLGLLELLQKAVRMEEDGRAYYLEVAGKTANGLAKSTFSVLADEEAKHRRYFEEYYQAMQQEKGWPDLAEMEAEAASAAKRAENVFTKAAAAGAVSGEDVDLTAAYGHAMDLERKAIEFYQGMVAAADDEQVKGFLGFVIDQERGHLDILSRTQDLLDSPEAWYFDTEGWVVEG
jgi:rubrerythrin